MTVEQWNWSAWQARSAEIADLKREISRYENGRVILLGMIDNLKKQLAKK